MQKIYKNLFVGNQQDYEQIKNDDSFAFINACKEPYHRQALGYTGRSCDKDNKEYLLAYRDNRLILNLVDVPNVDYIKNEIIDEALSFIYKNLLIGKNVLINCNLGESRSAIIGMLYLASIDYFKGKSFEESETEYKTIYQNYNASQGMRDYAKNNWNKYCKNEKEESNNVQ